MSSKHTRQKILDYLNANPGQTPLEIAENMSKVNDTIAKALRRMHRAGEVSRQIDFSLRGQPYRYWAGALEAKHYSEYGMKSEKKKPNIEPWRTVHRVTDKCKPIPNQGGQGSLRRQFGIQSGLA